MASRAAATGNGWLVQGYTASAGYISENSVTTTCPGVTNPNQQYTIVYTTSTYVFVDSTGYPHPFPGSNISSSKCTSSTQPESPTTLNAAASDGSGYKITASTVAVVTTPQGGTISSSGLYTDSNGNTGTSSNMLVAGTGGPEGNIQDSTGVSASVTSDAYTETTVQYIDTSGLSEYVNVVYKQYKVVLYNQSAGPVVTGSFPLVDSITYPDGSAYHFTYGLDTVEPSLGYYTGQLASIQLPSGGTISYSYQQNRKCTSQCVTQLARTTSDGTVTYNATNLSSTTSQTTVSKPGYGGTETVNFVQALIPSTGSTEYPMNLETAHVWQDSSGRTVKSSMRCYNASSGTCTSVPVSLPIAKVTNTTTLDNGLSAKNVISYDSSGRQMELDEYDFGGTSPLRITKTVYASLDNGILNRPHSVTVTDGAGNVSSQVTYGYDEYALAPSGVTLASITGSRGNKTSETYYDGTASHWQYDTAGKVFRIQDAAGAVANQWIQIQHDPTDTYDTYTTLPTPSSGVSMQKTAIFDPYTGLKSSSTDFNQGVTYYYYDSMLRLREIDFPDGGKNTVTYTPTETDLRRYQDSTHYAEVITQNDGYGRTSRTAIANGQATNGWYVQDTCYDTMGNQSFQSQRYGSGLFTSAKVCSSTGQGFTYDALNRPIEVSQADGSYVTYSYTGRSVEKTQQDFDTAVSTITQSDSLGRPIIVCELSSDNSMPGSGSPSGCGTDLAGTGFTTSYAYNLAADSITLTQGQQTRQFRTDKLGRPIIVAEPERGTTLYSYSYNSTGLLVTRSRPRANQTGTSATLTSSQYDLLGRLVSQTYNDGLTPSRSYYYDTPPSSIWSNGSSASGGKGLLVADTTTATNGTLSTASLYGHDSMGRILQVWRYAPSTCVSSSAMLTRPPVQLWYNGDGDLITEWDGASGKIVYARSPAGEITSITNDVYDDVYNPGNLVSNVVNGPNGPISYDLGNGLTVANAYDAMGRVSGTWACEGTSAAYCTGGTQLYGNTAYQLGTITRESCDTVNNYCGLYHSDEFGRLSTMSDGSGNLLYSYSYDRYGNRWAQTPAQGGSTSSLTFDPTTNRISTGGYLYDAAGNITNDTFNGYAYDAEGNVLKVMTTSGAVIESYTYDASNNRVSVATASGTTEYLFDHLNRQTSSWVVTTNFGNSGRIYWDGKQIAFRDQDGTTYFEHQNYLRTERTRTDYLGSVVWKSASLPWGDGISDTITNTNSVQDKLQFAGMDGDTVGTQHAKFRQYSPAMGRWMSPDPYGGSYAVITPQSLNRYVYALNNPVTLIDTSGLSVICVETPDQSYESDTSTTVVGGTQTCETEADGGLPDLTPSKSGLKFVANCEGFQGQVYNDTRGNCTIGYGHLLHSGPCTASDNSMTVSEPAALDQFASDSGSTSVALNKALGVPLTQSQYDATFSLAFNMGVGKLKTHDVWQDVQSGNLSDVPDDITSLGGGGAGIPARRANEANMFENGVYADACYDLP